MRRTLSSAAMVAVLGLSACGSADSPSTATTHEVVTSGPKTVPNDVKQAAELAKAIKAAPSRATEILEAAGTDEATFRQLLFEIAADAEKSAFYSQLTD